MTIAKRLTGKAISAWLGPTGEAARRAVTRAKQRLANAPRRLDFYFDLTDPWSYLAAQAVDRLVELYPVDLRFHVVTAPAADVNAMPLLRQKYAVRDAQELADYWDLDFPGKKEPDAGMVRDVGTVLIRERPAREQLRVALALASAMWRVDKKQLVTLVGTYGAEGHGSVLPVLNTAYSELRKAGHYWGAMIAYDGKWYWGVDRLGHLEQALARELGTELVHAVAPRPAAERGPRKLSDKPLVCELYFSFRSPYSYLALHQIEAILAPYEIPLVLRPVLPMVERGIPLPAVKLWYNLHDVKREADRLGIPFGEICDSLHGGVTNCLSIAHWAAARSPAAALAFAKSATRGIWSEAKDVASYVDLREVVERAGLPWEEAMAAIGDPVALKAAQENAANLNGIGLWGVPTFRVGEFVAWGQDRLPLLADRLRRHALA